MALSGAQITLPLDVIYLILSEIDDVRTLDNWCKAASGNSAIYEAALRFRCRKLLINSTSLIQDPTLTSFEKISWSGNESQRETCPREFNKTALETKWFSKLVGQGIAPAARLKEIAVCVSSREIINDYNSDDPWCYRDMGRDVFLEDAYYTLNLLRCFEPRLEKITWFGRLDTKFMETISGLSSHCRFLEIVRPETDRLALQSVKWHHPSYSQAVGVPNIRWSFLNQFSNLKTLKLRGGIRVSSEKVKELSIALEHLDINHLVLDHFCNPFNCTTAGSLKLPRSLRSLTVCYDLYLQVPRASERRLETRRIRLPNLTEIYAVFGDCRTGSYWFKYFVQLYRPPLRTISIPFDFFEDLAQRNELPTIEQITLKSIYYDPFDFVNRCSMERNTEFKYMSVIVGSRSNEFLWRAWSCHTSEYQSPYKWDQIDTRPYVLAREIPIWADLKASLHLRHMRLEQVELSSLRPTDFDLYTFKSLRVLMLYPWPYTQGACRLSLPDFDTPEHFVLHRVIEHAPPKLRILHIGCHRIWLRRCFTNIPAMDESTTIGASSLSTTTTTAVGAATEKITPVPLWLAKEDPGERKAMDAELEQSDWDFLASVPAQPVEDLSPATIQYKKNNDIAKWHEPGEEVITDRSYIVLRRPKTGTGGAIL